MNEFYKIVRLNRAEAGKYNLFPERKKFHFEITVRNYDLVQWREMFDRVGKLQDQYSAQFYIIFSNKNIEKLYKKYWDQFYK